MSAGREEIDLMLAETIAIHEGWVSTHSPICYVHHAGCLALAISRCLEADDAA